MASYLSKEGLQRYHNGIKEKLASKSDTNHTHSKDDITGPASDPKTEGPFLLANQGSNQQTYWIEKGDLLSGYLPKTAKAADADKLDGNDSTYYLNYNNLTNSPPLGTAASKNTGTSAGNIPILDSNGQLADSVIPAVAITDTYVVATEAAMLALSAQKGDIAIRSDLNKSFVLQSTPASTLANWKELLTPTDAVLSVNGKTGAVTLNLDNISDGSTRKLANYLPLTGGTLTGNLTLSETKNILLRPSNAAYTSGIGYDTSSNECIALWAKNSVTRLRWHAGTDMSNLAPGTMMDITPDFEISKASGTAKGYIAGQQISVAGHTHDDRYYTESEVDTKLSAKANLAGNNTFTGGQTITGDNDGYSINASGYVKGSWLQAPSTGKAASNTGKVCVLNNEGWVYYRTPAEIISDGGGATSSHTHTSLVSNTDNRNTNTTPNDYNAVFKISGLKLNSAIGLSNYGDYSCVLGVRGWGDSSGGNAHEIALTGDGYLMHRNGATTSWSDWKKIAYTSDIPIITLKSSGTGLSVSSTAAITSTGERTYTLDSSSAGNAAANKVILRNAAGSIQTEKLAISSGTTTKATMQYNATEDCIEFIFA